MYYIHMYKYMNYMNAFFYIQWQASIRLIVISYSYAFCLVC